MLIFKLNMHHLWGCVLAKFQVRAIAYADDGYIKDKVLAELKLSSSMCIYIYVLRSEATVFETEYDVNNEQPL
jgi:hypothetical protein